MKIPLELNIGDDGKEFLNFWDSLRGQDVCAEIWEGRLYLNGDLVSLTEFIDRVKTNFKESHDS